MELAPASPILKHYNGSLCEALKTAYKDHMWHEWRFGAVPKSYWENFANRQEFMSWLGKKLNIAEPSNWYLVTTRDFADNGGSGLLRHHYQDSVSNAVMQTFPHHAWLPWKFKLTPRGYWNSIENQRKFVDWFAAEHGIKNVTDWYSVGRQDVGQAGGSFHRYLSMTIEQDDSHRSCYRR
jgi:hypothetical protein